MEGKGKRKAKGEKKKRKIHRSQYTSDEARNTQSDKRVARHTHGICSCPVSSLFICKIQKQWRKKEKQKRKGKVKKDT
jgi:hypothetical protein